MTQEEKKKKRHERYEREKQAAKNLSASYYREHREQKALYNADYYSNPSNRLRIRKKQHEYYINHKEKWKKKSK